MHNSNKVVLITGASSGFGKLIVELLSKNQIKVIATMRDLRGKNSQVAKELSNLSKNITIEELDVSSTKSIEKAVNNTINKFNKIDVLINNAGIMNVGLAEGFTIAQLEKQMDVNYIGIARIFKEVIPHMRKNNGGLFITISSIAGRIIFPFLSTYNPSKFAVEALAEIYRYELSPFKIDSVIIEPGPFPTDLIKNAPHPDDTECLKNYGNLSNAAEHTMKNFQEFMKNNPDCDSNLVSNAVLNLINLPYGKRPMRTVCGLDYGVKEINSFNEKHQYSLLKQMGLDHLIPKIDWLIDLFIRTTIN